MLIEYNYVFKIVFGVLALGLGAEMIVRSSVSLASIYRVSGYFIGFTIVALGTSLPELAATIQALTEVNSIEIALGNIIGSNIANILLILGVVAIIYPIVFAKTNQQKNQIVVVLVITLAVFGIFYYVQKVESIYRIFIGIVLLLVLIGYVVWQYNAEFKGESFEKTKVEDDSLLKSYILLVIGLILLYFGSKYFVVGSKKFADDIGISETIIGVTLVAFGTSLPELATGILAAKKKQVGIAVGTILGSNIYNIVGIFAIILLLKPDEFPLEADILMINFIIMIFVTALFVLKARVGIKFFRIEPYRLGIRSGVFFLVVYVIYILFNYSNYIA